VKVGQETKLFPVPRNHNFFSITHISECKTYLIALFNSFVNLALIVLMRRGGETSLNWLLRIKTMLIGFL